MIKNVIFDMGGVLIDFNAEKMTKRSFEAKYHSTIMKNVFESDYWKMMDNGDISVDEAIDKMLLNIPASIHSQVRKMILNREQEMPALKDMTPIINLLSKNGYKLFVLSNCPSWFHEFKRNIPSIDLFDGFVISADYHISKPDIKIYKILINKFNLKADECLFIDDSPKNIAAAQSLGFKTICFKNQDFGLLKAELSEYGIEL